MATTADILKLRKQLLPTGRAFNVPNGLIFEELLSAKSISDTQLINDSLNILSDLIPDNDNFSDEAIPMWERALGIYGSETDILENRKNAIYSKMQFPSGVQGRQHKNYLEYVLNQNGFDVKVYEYPQIVDEINIVEHSLLVLHSLETIHGSYGISYREVISNYIDPSLEAPLCFSYESLKNCIWIAGNRIEDEIYIPENRLFLFRQIVLKIKPLQIIALVRAIPDNSAWILDTGVWNSEGYWLPNSLWQTI